MTWRTWLATASFGPRILIWDTATGRHRTLPIDATAIVVDPEATEVVTAIESVRVGHVTTGWQRIVFADHISSEVTAAVISPDGAPGSPPRGHDGSARIWDVATGRQRALWTGHKGAVAAVAIAPDRAWLTTVGENGTARTWDVTTGRQRAILTGHDGPVEAVAVAPDGTWVATAGDDTTARTWDVTTGRQRAILTGHDGPVGAVAVAPDGTWVATVSHQTLSVCESETGSASAVMRADSLLFRCAWHPSGNLLAAVGDAGTYLFAFNS